MTGPESSQIKVAKLALIGVIVAALIGAGATIAAGYIGSDPAPKTPLTGSPGGGSAPPAVARPAKATFTEPGPGAAHEPRTDIAVALVVNDLAPAHVVWLLARPEASAGQYYKTGPGPIAQRDGLVRYTDPAVGDETDSGSNYTYVAVDADQTCDTAIAKEIEQFSRLPESCTEIGAVTIPVN